jgi:hypothetical protein
MSGVSRHISSAHLPRYRVYLMSGRGFVVLDPKGDRVTEPVSSRDRAVEKCAQLQMEHDRPAKRGPRACLCCGTKFASEGVHNRMCGKCRGREVDGYSPYGLAPRSGRPR